jgi:hypothetical protein
MLADLPSLLKREKTQIQNINSSRQPHCYQGAVVNNGQEVREESGYLVKEPDL